jgi:nucleoside 2-deoxyribosyltransferase
MSQTQCPVWGSSVDLLPGYNNRDGTAVFSLRAGGSFFISRTAAVNINNSPDSLKIKVSFEIARLNALGIVPEILSTTIASLELQNDPTVEDRVRQLLRYFVRQTQHIGQSLSGFTVQVPYSHSNIIGSYSKVGPKADALLAWSGSSKSEEISFLIDMLVERGAVRIGKPDVIPNVTVLATGFDQVAAAASEPALDQAFVAMWFHDSMLEAYELGIDVAVRGAGYSPLRIDRKEHVNKIDDEIISEIRRSKFLIADFTSDPGSPRGGVYFEAGFALALGKPVIWTCRVDLIDHVHFDTRQFNHIVWATPDELAERLKNRIGAVIGQGPLKSS